MALTGTLTIEKEGVEQSYPECYTRIMVATSTKYDTAIVLNFYATQADREAEGSPVQQRYYTLGVFEGTLYSAIYTHLKTLPEFEVWSDI